MKKGFYGKTKACLLSAMVLVTANAVPAGAQESQPTDHMASYHAEETALYDGAGTNTNRLSVKLGDMNGDGKVSIEDVQTALKGILKLTELTEEQKLAADIDKDRKVTIRDVHYILKGALNATPDLDVQNNVRQLVEYMNKYGEEDPWGYKFITTTDSSKDNIIYYNPTENNLDFVQMKEVYTSSKTENIYISFTYDLSTLSAVDQKIYFSANCPDEPSPYEVISEASFDCKNFHKEDLKFVITESTNSKWTSTEFSNYANTSTQSAISDWNMLLYLKSGLKLSDIGFYSF